MKLLMIFAAALAGAQAIQLQYVLQGSGESSEEEYRLVLPHSGQPGYAVLDKPDGDSDESGEEEYRLLLPAIGQRQPGLAGVPIFQTVKVKVPNYGDASIRQQLFAQALAARGINLQYLASGVDPLTRTVVNLGGGVQDLNAQLLTRSAPNYGVQDLGAQLLGRTNLGGVQDLGAQLLARSLSNYGVQDLDSQYSVPNLEQSQVFLIRQQRQAPAPVENVDGEIAADVVTGAGEVEFNVVTEVPAVAGITKAPVGNAVVPPVVSSLPVVTESN